MVIMGYVCMCLGERIWKGILSMKTEGITDTKFKHSYLHKECRQGGKRKGVKSRSNVGFLIW